MNKSKMSRKASAIFLFISLFTMILVLCCCVIFIRIKNKDSATTSENQNRYQYFRYDPKTKKSVRGITKFFEILEKDQYQSFVDDSGNHILISHIGSKEFICSGSCFCGDIETGHERRYATTSSILKKGIVFFVASFSSILAYEKAKKYIEKECQLRYSDICPPALLGSKWDECKVGPDGEWETGKEKVYEEAIDDMRTYIHLTADQIDEEHEKQRIRKYYWCEGKCMNKPEMIPEHPHYWDLKEKITSKEFYELRKSFDCEWIECEGQVDFDTTGIKSHEWDEEARWDFQEHFMHPFCVMRGRKAIPFGETMSKEFGNVIINFCRGDDNGVLNPTIECRRLEDHEIQEWHDPDYYDTGLGLARDPKPGEDVNSGRWRTGDERLDEALEEVYPDMPEHET